MLKGIIVQQQAGVHPRQLQGGLLTNAVAGASD